MKTTLKISHYLFRYPVCKVTSILFGICIYNLLSGIINDASGSEVVYVPKWIQNIDLLETVEHFTKPEVEMNSLSKIDLSLQSISKK